MFVDDEEGAEGVQEGGLEDNVGLQLQEDDRQLPHQAHQCYFNRINSMENGTIEVKNE